MKRRSDDISFENAWEKQYADESKYAPPEDTKEVDDIKVHHPPAFRGPVSYTHLTLPTR